MLVSLDATRMLPNLYQGSMPPLGEAVKLSGYDLLVLCAKEYQPRADNFGVGVLHVPLDDDGENLPLEEWRSACRAAGTIVEHMRRGQKVLVTCVQGRNRSGLVVALVIHTLCHVSGDSVTRYIQSRRPHALTNRAFCRALQALPRGRRMEDPRQGVREVVNPVYPRPM